MDILALGVGEAGDPNYPNSSVAVEANGYRLLIDCGHSVPPVLWAAFDDPDAIDAIALTHRHPDHTFGLVPVLIRMTDEGRRAPLELIATNETCHHLLKLFQAGGLDPERSLSFPLHWRETPKDGTVGPFRVRTARTFHAVPNDAFRLEAQGLAFAYSGDGRPTVDSQELFHRADLLFHECLSVDPVPTQPYHASLAALADFPETLEVGQMRLYHAWANQRALLEDACAGLERISLAQPGERITL